MKITARKVVIIADMVLLVMTASWVLFGVSQRIDKIELFYNYAYIIVALITSLLNIKLLYRT